METGKVEYAPDYKSDKKRLPSVFRDLIGNQAANDIDAMLRERKSLAAERARLEREVIEAAKVWATAAKAEFNTGVNPDLNELLEEEKPLFAAVEALETFESQHVTETK